MKKLWKGNYAIVEGAIAGGVEAYFGYPITPQNEVTEYMSKRMRETGRVFLQSESELASISMVMGAALTGKKAMTSSSSPGISLMQEGISYLAGCELPCVIANVQRGGPGLGNIAGAQGDYFQTVKGGGHGDYRMLTFAPSTVREMYEMTRDSFHYAFKYLNPVIILADGVLGQMIEPADIHIENSSGTAGEKDLGWNLIGAKKREGRFIRSLLMDEGALEEHNYKLHKKFEKMKEEVSWEEKEVEGADIILVGYGTSARVNLDAWQEARKNGWKVGYFRLKTLYPFPYERLERLAADSDFLVVEMSMGQMVEDVRLASAGKNRVEFHGRPGGGIPEKEKIMELLGRMV